MEYFPDFFHFDNKNKGKDKALQDFLNTRKIKGKMAEYVKILDQNNKSKKQLLDLMEEISVQLLSVINNNNI